MLAFAVRFLLERCPAQHPGYLVSSGAVLVPVVPPHFASACDMEQAAAPLLCHHQDTTLPVHWGSCRAHDGLKVLPFVQSVGFGAFLPWL